MTMLQYARFYESIYSMPSSDKPDAEVIDDDEKLDQWYKTYTRDMALKMAKLSGKKADTTLDDSAKFKRLATFGGGGDNSQ